MVFEEIWNSYQHALSNFILTKVQDIAAKEDILQEVSIKLYQAIQKGIDIKNYQTWLFQVTRNTIIDHFRKQQVLANFSKTESLDLDQNNEETACICDIAPFVIQHYLPEIYSHPLYLSDIEQIPQKQVAELLGLSLSATKSRIQRGRKKLKELALECFDIQSNERGQVVDFQLKPNCELPQELAHEMNKVNFSL